MSKRLFLFFALSCVSISLSLAQQERFYGLGKLSSNLITRITQDSSGFIWIATENGLNKFDGWSFTHYFYNDKDSTSLSGNYIETFFTDDSGSLWIGANRGLEYYNPYKDSFIHVKFPDNTHPSVRGIIQLHSGEIWIVTGGYGLYSINKQTMTATSLTDVNKLLAIPYSNHIFEDRAHQIWIVLSESRMACISPDKKSVKTYDLPIDPQYKVYGITEDHMGRMFVATSSCVFLWDIIRQDFMRIKNDEPNVNIRGIACLKDGMVYVNTLGQGLKYIDTNTMTLVTPSKLKNGYDNPIKERITTFFEDNKGNLWFGCNQKGLLMGLNEPTQFDFWYFKENGETGSITSLYQDRENELWLGTDNGKLHKINNRGKILESYNIQKDVSTMYEDISGTFWIGSYQGGVYTFDKRSGKSAKYPSFEGKSVVAIAEDKKKNVYISVLGEGFIRYNIETKKWILISDKTRLANDQVLSNNWINDILCDSDGLIWLAHSIGVDCYDPDKSIFLHYSDDASLSSMICTTLMEDKKKNIWIGTNNGLYKYDKKTKKIEHYGMEEGLPNNIICGLGTDAKGNNIWGSTLNGIFQLNIETGRIACYYTGNGLVDREFSKNIFLQDKMGYLYFGGLYGVTKFLPDSIKALNLDFQPKLTHLYINNVSVSADKIIKGKPISETRLFDASEINLSYNEKSFSLEFSTMNYHNPENVIFEYRLLGMNEEWISTFPGENRITYNFLSPGNYTLEVRAFENNAYSSIKTLNIKISPPWYSTTWATSLYVLLFIGILTSIVYTWQKRQQRRREEQNNEDKLKFFINIAHEIRSPTTLIISPLSELLKTEYDEKTKKLLETIQRNAHRIMSLINQLLDIRKIDKGQMKIACQETDMVGFIKDLTLVFDYQANKRDIKFSFESTEDRLPVWIDRNNFDKVLMNLLINAFKYTKDGGEIKITLATIKSEDAGNARKYAEINIIDSGLGLNEKEVERIFERFYQAEPYNPLGFGIGLNLCKLLVELHHGTIKASNRKDIQGSCFTVRIPIGNEHFTKEDIVQQSETIRFALETPICWEEKDHPTVAIKNKKRQRILVVDDDEGLQEYIQRELSASYKVVTANNGSEALQILLQERIDLVISDVAMPEMDGFTLLKKIRNNENISHIPVILLTSQVEADSRMMGWNVGADGFMDKPFLMEELLFLCNNLISNRSLLKGKFVGVKELEEKVTPLDIKSNDDLFIERLMTLINKNIDNSKFSIEALSKEVGISRTQLHRKLKEITGITTSDFIRNVRLKQAAKLLVEKKVNISQVAYATGFSNPTIFAVAFKKFYGCTPTEYAERGES